MNLAEAWPYIAFAAGCASAYFGAKNAMTVAIARVEERLNALADVVDSDHAKLDELRMRFAHSEHPRV